MTRFKFSFASTSLFGIILERHVCSTSTADNPVQDDITPAVSGDIDPTRHTGKTSRKSNLYQKHLDEGRRYTAIYLKNRFPKTQHD